MYKGAAPPSNLRPSEASPVSGRPVRALLLLLLLLRGSSSETARRRADASKAQQSGGLLSQWLMLRAQVAPPGLGMRDTRTPTARPNSLSLLSLSLCGSCRGGSSCTAGETPANGVTAHDPRPLPRTRIGRLVAHCRSSVPVALSSENVAPIYMYSLVGRRPKIPKRTHA